MWDCTLALCFCETLNFWPLHSINHLKLVSVHFTSSWHVSVQAMPSIRNDNGHTVGDHRRAANTWIPHMSTAASFYSVPMVKGKITISLPISPDNIIKHLDLAMPEANRPQILQLHESITAPFSLTWVEKFPVSIDPTIFYFYHL